METAKQLSFSSYDAVETAIDAVRSDRTSTWTEIARKLCAHTQRWPTADESNATRRKPKSSGYRTLRPRDHGIHPSP